MNEREEPETLGPEERKALNALKAMPYPQPGSPGAAKRAMAAFLTGESTAAGAEPAPLPLRPRGRSPLRWVPALAAVVAMAILGWWGMSPRGSWVVTAGVPQGTVRVEGGSGAYGAVVSPGQVAVLDTVEFELQLAHDVRIRLVPGTVAELPKPPRRFFPPDPVLAVTHGEVYGTTSGPLPYRFILETPEARAVLTGTTFAVIRSETATCFCLFEGTLAVTDRIQGGERTLEPGNRLFVYRDGRPALSEPIDEAERAKLTMMSTQAIMETLPEPPDRGPR